MKQKTNINSTQLTHDEQVAVATAHLARDVKNSVLIVSVLANLFVVSLWVAVQVTSRYDEQLASFSLIAKTKRP